MAFLKLPGFQYVLRATVTDRPTHAYQDEDGAAVQEPVVTSPGINIESYVTAASLIGVSTALVTMNNLVDQFCVGVWARSPCFVA